MVIGSGAAIVAALSKNQLTVFPEFEFIMLFKLDKLKVAEPVPSSHSSPRVVETVGAAVTLSVTAVGEEIQSPLVTTA